MITRTQEKNGAEIIGLLGLLKWGYNCRSGLGMQWQFNLWGIQPLGYWERVLQVEIAKWWKYGISLLSESKQLLNSYSNQRMQPREKGDREILLKISNYCCGLTSHLRILDPSANKACNTTTKSAQSKWLHL